LLPCQYRIFRRVLPVPTGFSNTAWRMVLQWYGWAPGEWGHSTAVEPTWRPPRHMGELSAARRGGIKPQKDKSFRSVRAISIQIFDGRAQSGPAHARWTNTAGVGGLRTELRLCGGTCINSPRHCQSTSQVHLTGQHPAHPGVGNPVVNPPASELKQGRSASVARCRFCPQESGAGPQGHGRGGRPSDQPTVGRRLSWGKWGVALGQSTGLVRAAIANAASTRLKVWQTAEERLDGASSRMRVDLAQFLTGIACLARLSVDPLFCPPAVWAWCGAPTCRFSCARRFPSRTPSDRAGFCAVRPLPGEKRGGRRSQPNTGHAPPKGNAPRRSGENGGGNEKKKRRVGGGGGRKIVG